MDFVEREYTFWDQWTIFRKRKNLILLSAATAAVGAFVLSFLLPKTFSATATLFIPEPRMADTDNRMLDFIYYDLLRSWQTSVNNNYLIQKTIENFGLQNAPYGLSVDKFKRQQVLQVELLKSTRLLKVNGEFPDARLAADIANFFAASIISLSEEVAAKDTQATRLLIKDQLDRAAQESESSLQSLMQFHKTSRLEELRETVRNLLEEKSKNEAELSRLDIALVRNTAKREWLLAQLKEQSPEIQLKRSPDVNSAYLGSDKAKLSPNTPIKEESMDLLHQHIRAQILEANSEIVAINAGMQMLRKKLGVDKQKLALRLQEKITKENTFEQLSLVSKLASDTYASFNKKYQDAAWNMGAVMHPKVISPALPPDRPHKPRILLNVVLGACFGFMASTLLTFLFQNLELAKSGFRRETSVHQDEKVREIRRSGKGL
ncbi:MAG: hypothetical protein DMG06_19150 [Acidobacteria bacterium]|nr:MAG: hypothetical protein DMG06_19150 [Acidobacteriota bacterium]